MLGVRLFCLVRARLHVARRIVDKALGQEGEGSPADSAAAARHFADDSREDVTAVLTSLEAKAETVKRLL